jgi:hypothetical protein
MGTKELILVRDLTCYGLQAYGGLPTCSTTCPT